MSGGRGEIVVAKEVPYADWFQVWGQGNGLWQPGIQWKEVGARMGGRARRRERPHPPRPADPGLLLPGGRPSLTTSVTQLSTEVMAREGQEIDLGGVPFSDRQFLDKFLVGFDESGETVPSAHNPQGLNRLADVPGVRSSRLRFLHARPWIESLDAHLEAED
jgi:hypothetical protein